MALPNPLLRQTRLLLWAILMIVALSGCICRAGSNIASGTTSPSHRLLSGTHRDMGSEKFESKNSTECLKKMNRTALHKTAFDLLDASFFNETEMLEIEKSVGEFNIPIIKANRKLVASSNGGLHDPSYLVFTSRWGGEEAQEVINKFSYPSLSGVKRPKSEEDIAFMSVLELGQLIKTKQITSLELTQIFLNRLKRYNPVLEAVVTCTEELAYEQAKEADELLARGTYLGPLHGIPYGLKDIIAVPHYKTTWGFKNFQRSSPKCRSLGLQESAGAVLVAKLVSGSLAYDDIWFGGRTRNPWNIEEYSTGSSAGPAACTSAGMVPFAIGSETAGSITFPAARCGVTALRPTFGTVGRTGVMSIAESLDDLSSRNMLLSDPFSVDIKKLTVGYLDDAEMEVVHVLQSKGVHMVPFKLNYTVESVQGILNFTMDVEMLAHFDEWQRSRQDHNYEAQDQWPVELRRTRLIPAVDYFQRGENYKEVKESFKVDAFVGNATDWERVCLGNLIGMPVIVVPTGFKNISNQPSDDTRRRTTITTGIYAPPEHDHIVSFSSGHGLSIGQQITINSTRLSMISGQMTRYPNPPTVTVPRSRHLCANTPYIF
ncbi:amidase family protein [Actinidia rufa]|uniref:Amidase family protein n=1 Tax=Actinidia rufa TaxID=165716 RepID=A0A7J0H2H5_9ERIC|nr:amidase family protein [Actinidia rufa]